MKSINLPAGAFDKDHAEKYDSQWEKLEAVVNGLHLFTHVILSDLPDDAHILCVGAGTGAEIFALAERNPGWRFTAVDPAAPMLDVCRAKADEQGLTSRCTFHTGYVSSLSGTEKYDAATCFLVSHFLIDEEERQALFSDIASRLVPNGILVNADISGDMTSPEFERLLQVWVGMFKYGGIPADNIEKMRASLGKNVAALPPAKVANLIQQGGFKDPTLFYQCVMIHAWYSHIAP